MEDTLPVVQDTPHNDRKDEIIRKLRMQQTSIVGFAQKLKLLPTPLKWTTPPPSIANSLSQALIFRQATGKWPQFTSSFPDPSIMRPNQKSIFAPHYYQWDSVIKIEQLKHWGILGCSFSREASTIHSSCLEFDHIGSYLLQGYPSGEILLGDFQTFQNKLQADQQKLLTSFEKNKNLPLPFSPDVEEGLQIEFVDQKLGFVHRYEPDKIEPVAFLPNDILFKP
jgi:hypothetical protein